MGSTSDAIELIAFDADDTLWHNESLYAEVQARFGELLLPYNDAGLTAQKLLSVEMRNLPLYGYGIKSFALSMIEAAIDISAGQICSQEVQAILDLARGMLTSEIRLFEHTRDVVAALAARYPLLLITKGDLLDQESKIDRSGLRPYFRSVEILSDKTAASYQALLEKNGVPPGRFLMVGNSLRSDILPVTALGGRAVYIPYHLTWEHEQAELSEADLARVYRLEHIGQLPGLVERLSAA